MPPGLGLDSATIGQPSLLRDGWPALVKRSSPVAGADLTTTIDGSFIERLLVVWCRLVTSATVANREVVLQFLTPEGSVMRSCGAGVTVQASTTIDYSFSVWQPVSEWPVDAGISIPLDPILLFPTFQWRLHVVNIDTTDQISAVRVYREKFFSDSPIPGRDYGVG